MALAVPAALLSGERGRRFFADWVPLFAFWLVYDRLRLVQPLLYSRVAVERPLAIEHWVFGWLTGGAVPAHAANAWLATHSGSPVAAFLWTAQLVYFSHLVVVPLVLLSLWLAGASNPIRRASFTRHLRAFTLLNFGAVAIYLLLPVAPPWWVTLNGMAQPDTYLVAHTDMTQAMQGTLVQGMIRNASQWFAALPSLHGAYPVLLFLLCSGKRKRGIRFGIVVYSCAMWTATVVLNQHYIIDLMAGAVLAVAAWRVSGSSPVNAEAPPIPGNV